MTASHVGTDRANRFAQGTASRVDLLFGSNSQLRALSRCTPKTIPRRSSSRTLSRRDWQITNDRFDLEVWTDRTDYENTPRASARGVLLCHWGLAQR